MAHKLGLKVIAEGVETEAQAAFLVKEGCEEAQGFLYSSRCPPTNLRATWSGIAPLRKRASVRRSRDAGTGRVDRC
jgi:sensor c-di-GMP phosphodiesterase-like protein